MLTDSIYVSGRSAGSRCITIKYDADGNTIWEKVYNSSGVSAGRGNATDPLGNLYVVGVSSNGTNDDYFIIKYDSDGNTIWQKTYNSGLTDWAHAVATDLQGKIYVTGYSVNTSGNEDWFTVKYDTSGNTLWQKVCDGGSLDKARDIAVDTSGNVYVTGFSYSTHMQGLTIKYRQVSINASPILKWTEESNYLKNGHF